jgi:hypothetical protein
MTEAVWPSTIDHSFKKAGSSHLNYSDRVSSHARNPAERLPVREIDSSPTNCLPHIGRLGSQNETVSVEQMYRDRPAAN